MILDYIRQHKLITTSVAMAIVMAISGLVYYRIFVFQVVSTSPANGSEVVSSSPLVTITFNKSLDNIDQTKQVITNQDIIKGYRVSENQLLLQLTNLSLDQTYSIQLLNISSVDGSTINSYEYSFTYKYTPYNKLSNQQKSSQISQTDKGNIDSKITKALPITTSTYYISYKLLDKPDSKGKYENLTIALLLTNQDLNDVQKIRLYKQQAIDYLKVNGINIADYNVTYAPAQANQY